MAQMNMIEAIRDAMDVVMDKDPSVIIIGEDVGYFGGVFRCTDGGFLLSPISYIAPEFIALDRLNWLDATAN